MAEKTGDSSIIGTDRACTNRRSRKNEYSNDIPQSEDRVHSIQPIYYGYE